MAPKSRKISWASDSESDISDYDYNYRRTARKTSSGRDTFPRNKKSHMNNISSRYDSEEERQLNARANGRWGTMMNGRYMWFAGFMVLEMVNVIVPWVVYFLILDSNNEAKAGQAVQRGNWAEALHRFGKSAWKHTRGQDDLWYYPTLAALMTAGALYIGILLAVMRSTRNVPIAIGVKVLQVLLCLSVGIFEMARPEGDYALLEMGADMLGFDRGYRYGMPAYFSLTVVNMIIAAMLYFAFFWQSVADNDDKYAAQQERRALLAEKGRYSATGSDSEDEAERVSKKKSPKKLKKEAYPEINSPQKVENYYYNTAPVPINTQVYTVPSAAPQVTTYQIDLQPQPVEYTTTTTTIDVNTLPSRYENGQTIYTVDLN